MTMTSKKTRRILSLIQRIEDRSRLHRFQIKTHQRYGWARSRRMVSEAKLGLSILMARKAYLESLLAIEQSIQTSNIQTHPRYATQASC